MRLTPDDMNQVADRIASANPDWQACHWDTDSKVAVVMDAHCGITVAVIGEHLTVVGRNGTYADSWQAAFRWVRNRLNLAGEDAGSAAAVATRLRHSGIEARVEYTGNHATVVVARAHGTIHAHATRDDRGATITVSARGSVPEADRLVITHSVTDTVEAIHHAIATIDHLGQ